MEKQLYKDMANYDSNYEIAQAISEKIGVSPIPFDSVYSIALKIYQELGGEETQFDSVYSILLGILPLAGGGGGTIEDVNALPDASQYKNKVVRLTTDNNLYQSYLKSSETITTNKLPDEQQIDKAYLYNTGDDSALYYKGIWKIICTDGEISLSCWGGDFVNDIVYFTYDNAENINYNSKTLYYGDTMYDSVDEDTKTIIDNETIENLKSLFNIRNSLIPIPAIYNAPESAQIGNATFNDGNQGYIAKYSGEEVSYNGSTWYKWIINDVGYYITNKKASEIYGDFKKYWLSDAKIVYFDGSVYAETELYSNITSINIPQLNAPDSEQVDNAYISDAGSKYLYKGQYTLLNEDNSIYASNVAGFFETGFMMFAKDWLPNEVYYQNIDSYDAINSDNSNDIELLPNNTIKVISGNTWHNIKVNNIFGVNGIELHPVKYQRTETIDVWDWKALTNDWAVGATYRYYNPDVAGTSYGPLEWLTAILNFTMKDSTKEYLQKLNNSGYGDGTFLMVHFKSWTGTEWIEDMVAITVANALNVGGIFGSVEEFSAYINNILNVKANEYDAHNYIYITNIGIYLYDILWNTETQGFVMNDFSDAIAFPINTDMYPEYIELYPQKNE